MPIFSLASRFGIGCFSKEAFEFVDFLEKSGQGYWQVLPLGPTGYGNSPYQPLSAFAGNPYFISPEKLIEEGLLSWDDVNCMDFGGNQECVDYGKLYENRYKVLEKAYDNFLEKGDKKELEKYSKENAYWLEDYALYLVIKELQGGKSWTDWDKELRSRDKKVIDEIKKNNKKEMEFIYFQQFKFDEQWKALKKYANDNGILIVGDIPIYVSPDGADTWSEPELFQLDEKGYPEAVAGCPPDCFTEDGQLWGNPLYDWDYHKKTGYKWWMRRLEACFNTVDIVRIDHFRGFYSYWSIPYGDKNARGGKWIKGPGMDLFNTLKEKLGDRPVIAEDLGFLTEGVVKMVEKTGYPGMKIMQFGFDPSANSEHAPHTYDRNYVVYTGTHDNDTILHWSLNCDKKTAKYAMKYLNVDKRKDLPSAIVRACFASVADTCIIPLQDFLELDNEARINTPSTLGDNWKWRTSYTDWTQKLSKRMNKLVKTYGRENTMVPR